MADAVDMSLDDIIKQQRKNNRNNKTKSMNNNNNSRPRTTTQSRIRPKINNVKQQPIKRSPIKDNSEQLLHISNLHFGVSNKDLKELFEDIGPLKKATVHYDKSGRSLGTAEVTFFSRDAAIRAINKYNQRHLDGRPMDIKLVPNRPTLGLKSDSGIKKRSPQRLTTGRRTQPQGQNNKGPRQRNPGPRKGKPGNKRQPKPEITAEQLDAELESYKEEKMNVE